MLSFKELRLSPALDHALVAMKYEKPTPIQAQAIPVIYSGKDVIGCAQTGTGKTAAFCLPMISKLEAHPKKTALVLVPTRELAQQVAEVVKNLTVKLPEMRHTLLIGGVSMEPQFKNLARHPRIIVATPGRLLDHLRRRSINLQNTEFLVLDEADRMLDMGFAPQLNEVVRFLPKQRQTLLFSATVPTNILKLAAKYLHDPVRVNAGPTSKPAEKINQTVVRARTNTKNDVLLDELYNRKGSILIFARTKKRTDRLARFLGEAGHKVNRIHGDRSQAQRNSAIDGFKNGSVRILVATDVAARGIDIPHIAHVINYDLPQCADDYVHRIGRTARAGATGEALSILTPEDNSQWKAISRLVAVPDAGPNPAPSANAGSGGGQVHHHQRQPRRQGLHKKNSSHRR